MLREDPRFVVHAVYGPPRPVVVVALQGSLGERCDHDLSAVLAEAAALAGTRHGRTYFGCRRPDSGMVLDLRAADFVGDHALAALATSRRDGDHAGPPRLLIDRDDSEVPRALHRLGLTDAFEMYSAIGDAVLGATPRT